MGKYPLKEWIRSHISNSNQSYMYNIYLSICIKFNNREKMAH